MRRNLDFIGMAIMSNLRTSKGGNGMMIPFRRGMMLPFSPRFQQTKRNIKEVVHKRSILVRIGDKHHLQGFLKMLLVRCSYSIFDHIKYIHLLLTNGSIEKVERNKFLEKSAIDLISAIHHLFSGVQSHDGKVENVKFDQDTASQHRPESSIYDVDNRSFSLTVR